MSKNPRILIAGTGSGCGKTTITCAILQALKNRGMQLASFKCGPDYIDPMFHSKVIGTKSRNLDIFMLGEDKTKELLYKNSIGYDLSVIEGVMGFYDGIGGTTSEASACHLSNLTDTPVILVVNIKGMSLSAAAMINGYVDFQNNNIKGVILNGVSKMMLPYYKDIIEKNTKIKVYGCMTIDGENSIESRHLGLITADEIDNLKEKINRLAQSAQHNIDLEEIIKLASTAPDLEQVVSRQKSKSNIRIGVAQDKAFCFYYQDSLDVLIGLGAEIIPFSPLEDKGLPKDIDGLYLGGGYPELYCKQLSKNTSMLDDIKQKISNGLPTIAECGGFMVLHNQITDQEGNSYKMVGVIDGEAKLTNKLSNFGYVTLTAKTDGMLLKKGEQINAHEFHYSVSTNSGSGFIAQKPLKNKNWDCIHTGDSLFAGYPHFHFYANEDVAKRFIEKCQNYKRR